MRKMLIGIDSLRIGGIQTALINLLNCIDYEKYEITLQLFHYDKDDTALIPPEVRIKKASFLLDVMNQTLSEAKKNGPLVCAIRLGLAVLCRIVGAEKLYSFAIKTIEDTTEYDEAISFTNNGASKSLRFGMNRYILERVCARKKSSWLHVDFEQMGLNTPYNISEYKRFDRIIHVSQAAKETFLKYVPEMRNQSYVIYNVVDGSKMRDLAKEYVQRGHELGYGLNLVTVCRLDANKNVIACIRIARRLKDRKIPFNWTIIGDGSQREHILKEINKSGLNDHIAMMGYMRNPYGIIKNSDLLISTTKTESYGMSIAEAISLQTPIISYSYPALYEIIEEGKNGFIVQQGDEEGMARKIEEIWKKQEIPQLKKTCMLKHTECSIVASFEQIFS